MKMPQHRVPVTQEVTWAAKQQKLKSNFRSHLYSLLQVKLLYFREIHCSELCLFTVKLPHSHLVLIIPHYLRSCAISFSSQTLHLLGRHNKLLYPILLCWRQSWHCPSPSVTTAPRLFWYTERLS